MCTQIASYYGLAVQRNKWKQFKCYARIKAVNAIPLHLGANDTNVEINQRNCPYFEDIWCQYQAVKFIKRPIHNIPTFSRKQRLILYLPSLIVVNITAEFIEKLCGGHWPVLSIVKSPFASIEYLFYFYSAYLSAKLLCQKQSKYNKHSKVCVGLHIGGHTIRGIGRTLSLPPSTVSFIVRRWKKTGSTHNLLRSGRLKKVSPRGVRYLKKIVKQNRRNTLRHITEGYNDSKKIKVSSKIISRELHKMDFGPEGLVRSLWC
ncbi:hypothetical protein LOD99_15470 [Oopsacas minuta]|uniref:Transposase Tc1-like domain-containing protein n=1 Tax=Oopsacas minuta TaxID=111878 RepID=A0AAV7KAX3_9METZ|nr:hypothetical protein LOD99_15470 [Oopsacas minuta]